MIAAIGERVVRQRLGATDRRLDSPVHDPFGKHSVEEIAMCAVRLTSLVVAAGLSLLSGCQSSGGCGNGGGFLSRLTSRRATVVYDGPVMATPMNGMAMPGCCDGGPVLGDPTVINGGMMPYPGSATVMPGEGTLPGMIPPTMPTVPSTPTPPGATLPPPSPSTAPPPLAPVPTTPGLATPVPAQPSGRRR